MNALDNSRGNLITVALANPGSGVAGLLNVKPVETPIATGITGQLQFLGQSKEGDVSGQHERSQPSAYKFSTRNIFDVDGLIEAGLYYRETHYRNPDTKGWVARSTQIQYRVDHVDSPFMLSREKTLSMSRKGVTNSG